MATPVILYRNLFRAPGVVITSSGTATGFSADALADQRAYRGWQGDVLTSPQWVQADVGAGGVNADSILFVNHNLVADGGQVTIKADNSDPPTTVVQATYSPTSDVADYKAFTAPGAARYWRVEFSDPSAPFSIYPFVGELLVGLKVSLSEYAAPDVDPSLHGLEAVSNRSNAGHFIGSIMRGVTRRGTMRFGGDAGLPRSLFTSDLNDFVRAHYRKLLPFGLVLDTSDSEYSAPLWLKKPDRGDANVRPVGGTYARFMLSLDLEEAYMEASP